MSSAGSCIKLPHACHVIACVLLQCGHLTATQLPACYLVSCMPRCHHLCYVAVCLLSHHLTSTLPGARYLTLCLLHRPAFYGFSPYLLSSLSSSYCLFCGSLFHFYHKCACEVRVCVLHVADSVHVKMYTHIFFQSSSMLSKLVYNVRS
jgi:hypothetical protein